MSNLEKLKSLRQLMAQDGIDAYVVPSSDPHISEYLPEHFKCIEWLSGFSGSAGTLVITKDFAGLWTDSRYFVQAEEQLHNSGFALMKLKTQGVSEYVEWIAKNLPKGSVAAFDGWLASTELCSVMTIPFSHHQLELRTDVDLIFPIWQDRPKLELSKIILLPENITGESSVQKIHRIQQVLKDTEFDYHLISALDDIAWILNVRGSDIKCNPLVLSHLLISQSEVKWFVNESRISEEQKTELHKQHIKILPYESILIELVALEHNKSLLYDSRKVCQRVFEAIPEYIEAVKGDNPSTLFKSIKNKTEQEHLRQTMAIDGAAMVRFLKWLEEYIGKEEITELSAAVKLKQFRAMYKDLVGDSFTTISAYRGHAALPHYSPTLKSNSTLHPNGIFLIDSGGQYLTGTTDITRTITLGSPTREEIEDNTRVLQGMIDLSMVRFPEGTKGYQLDAYARKWLWKAGCNFGHGTGHGVGFFLNVHEGPQNISTAAVNVPFKVGMLNSNEPGIYRPEKHGIRIENLVFCQEDIQTEFGNFFKFETVTLCPIDTKLIDKSMMTQKQIDWLNAYHKTVYDKISPLLKEEEKQWLAEKTKDL